MVSMEVLINAREEVTHIMSINSHVILFQFLMTNY